MFGDKIHDNFNVYNFSVILAKFSIFLFIFPHTSIHHDVCIGIIIKILEIQMFYQITSMIQIFYGKVCVLTWKRFHFSSFFFSPSFLLSSFSIGSFVFFFFASLLWLVCIKTTLNYYGDSYTMYKSFCAICENCRKKKRTIFFLLNAGKTLPIVKIFLSIYLNPVDDVKIDFWFLSKILLLERDNLFIHVYYIKMYALLLSITLILRWNLYSWAKTTKFHTTLLCSLTKCFVFFFWFYYYFLLFYFTIQYNTMSMTKVNYCLLWRCVFVFIFQQ